MRRTAIIVIITILELLLLVGLEKNWSSLIEWLTGASRRKRLTDISAN